MKTFRLSLLVMLLTTSSILSTARAVDLGNDYSLSNVTYLDYSYATGDHFDPNNTNFGSTAESNKGYADGFHFTRIYLTLRKQINYDLMVRIPSDQATARPDGNQ